MLEQERRDNAEANVESIREDGDSMNSKMGEDKKKTREMVSKMTQIYKSMEKSYNEKIMLFETEVE